LLLLVQQVIDSYTVDANIIKKALEIQPKEFLYYYEKYFEKDFIPLI
jgi:hypothetical protein